MGLRAGLEQTPRAFEVLALVVVDVLALIDLHVDEPVVERKDKVHASKASLAPIEPDHDFTMQFQAGTLQEA